MGQDDEAGQVKPIACTLPTCQQRFETIKGMKRHKSNDPAHYYCKKCDVDCEDWEDLTLHKVYAMQPWLEGKMANNEEERPKHIVCEFCGEDFKSFGGRRLHRLKHHQADQHVTCPGCKYTFVRAGDFIYHLENGECQRISRERFLGHIQQKLVHEEIWKGVDTIQKNFAHNEESKELAQLALRDGEEDNEVGGVDLLEFEDESSSRGIETLQTQLNQMDVRERSSPQVVDEKKWPLLLSQESKTNGVNGKAMVNKNSSPASSSTGRATAPPEEDDETVFVGRNSARQRYPITGNGVWNTGNTTQALFQDAKPTPPAGDWAAILNERKESVEAATQSVSLLDCRFWDPKSADYDPQRFYNAVTERYHCPFEGCQEISYEDVSDMEGHWDRLHLNIAYDCPACGKRFRTGAALMSHATAPNGKCKVKHGKHWGKLVNLCSGGFLKAEDLRLPRVARGSQIQPGGGLMEVKFTAETPKWAEMNGQRN